mmetsp:Transcript_74103/g.131038  ORF Transcript_74103/g.131038 Transcript_74103/m.131038 type:complete len:134 (+) Transcript_74103:398-799(+)
MQSILYARLSCSEGAEPGGNAARCTKSAITALLDAAEACSSCKITIGLSPVHASCAELICSLLYLGFQVVPARKCPLADTALLVEFDIGPPPTGNYQLSSDHTCSGTSDCSTSAEDQDAGRPGSESPESPDSD